MNTSRRAVSSSVASLPPAVAHEPQHNGIASSPRALQNLASISCLSSLNEMPFQSFPGDLQAPSHRSSRVVSSSFQRADGEMPQESSEDECCHKVEVSSEEENANFEGKAFTQGSCILMSGRNEPYQLEMCADPLPCTVPAQGPPRFHGDQSLKSSRLSAFEEPPRALTNDVPSTKDRGCRSGHSSEAESKNTSQHSDSSSSEKDLIDRLSLHTSNMGPVSPLRALTHVAHIKRKQDCLQNHVEQGQPDVRQATSVDAAQGLSSKTKRLKRVHFKLEPLAYQKLTKILAEQYEGSIERFIISSLNLSAKECNPVKRAASSPRKLALSKWKRIRFEQLKGTETEELALAFRSLAEATQSVDLPSDLLHLPWQELNMLQVQKMLEETKKMLLINEKVHDCPFIDCGRRFSTPGHLKDHLNEHSGEEPYSCTFEDCAHRFRSKQHLCRHLKKHEQAHLCTFEGCNKRFAFRERLIVHQKTHSDERPLSCPWGGCGKTFKWANSLHGHLRTHTGEKPFQCTFAGCGRLFGYKVDLTRHLRTHFGKPARASI